MVTKFDAIADSNRRNILDLLRERPHQVGEIVSQLGLSQPLVSKHLKVLKTVGLVSVRKDAQRRWYQLETAPLQELDEWLDAYRHLWDARFDRLDKYLQDLQEKDKDNGIDG